MTKYEFLKTVRNVANIYADQGDKEAEAVMEYLKGDFSKVDPRRWASYVASQSKEGWSDPAIKFYREHSAPNDFTNAVNASDIYPHEMAGQDESTFYDYEAPMYWAGTEVLSNGEGLDRTRGLGGIAARYGISPSEFMDVLRQEQTERDSRRAMDFDDPVNYDEGANKYAVKFRNAMGRIFWPNTIKDNSNRRDVANVGGLSLSDLALNAADAGTMALKGIPGLVSDVAVPAVREAVNTATNYTDYDPSASGKETAIRLGGRGAAKVGSDILGYGAKIFDDYLPGVSKKLDDVRTSLRGGETLGESVKANSKEMERQVASKKVLPSELHQGKVRTDASPSTSLRYKDADASTQVQDLADDYDVFVGDDGFLFAAPKDKAEGIDKFVKFDKDGRPSKVAQKDPSSLKGEYARLSADIPGFRAFMEGTSPEGVFRAVPVVEKAVPVAAYPATVMAARQEPRVIDVGGVKNTNEDFKTLEQAYNSIAADKPQAVRNWMTSADLDPYERSIVDKYMTMKLFWGNQ